MEKERDCNLCAPHLVCEAHLAGRKMNYLHASVVTFRLIEWCEIRNQILAAKEPKIDGNVNP